MLVYTPAFGRIHLRAVAAKDGDVSRQPSTRTLLSAAVGFTYSLRQQWEGALVAIQGIPHLGWIHLRTAAAQGGSVSGKLATTH